MYVLMDVSNGADFAKSKKEMFLPFGAQNRHSYVQES